MVKRNNRRNTQKKAKLNKNDKELTQNPMESRMTAH